MTASTLRKLASGSHAVTLMLDAEAMQFATQAAKARGFIDAEDYLQAIFGTAMVNEMAEAEMWDAHADAGSAVAAFGENDEDSPVF